MCQVLYLFALSYYFIRSSQSLYKLDILIIPTLQMRKLASEQLRSLLKDSQLVSDEASVLANPKVPHARIKAPEPYILLLFVVKNSSNSWENSFRGWCSK